MISLAGRDILHAWGKFIFTGVGLGLVCAALGAWPRAGGIAPPRWA